MDTSAGDDNQVHAESKQLSLALLLSVALHALLLSLTFGDSDFGLPGLNPFWQDQPAAASSLRVELTSPALDTPPEPAPVVVVEQRKVARVVTRRTVLPPDEPKAEVMAAAPRPEPKPEVVPVVVERSREVESPPPPPPPPPPTPVVPEPEPVAAVPPIELPKQEAKPDQAKTAQLEREQQEAVRQEVARAETERREADRRETERRETARREAERQAAEREAQRQETAKREAARVEAARVETERQEAARREAIRIEAERREAARLEAERQEALRLEAARAAAREDEERREARLRAIGRQLDEEAAQREAAAKLPRSLSTARRLRLLARTDPNVELVQYAEAMARKIQMNTPADMVRDLARRPHTDPLVTVAIRSDGSVESVSIVVSSGVAEIDAAIRSIVQSQAPYQAFPPGLARQADVVEVRRTWYFDVAVRLN